MARSDADGAGPYDRDGSPERPLSRGAWSIVDQGISSVTNFGATIVLARLLGPEEFGSFALALASWFLVLSMARAVLMQPFLISASVLSESSEGWFRETGSAARAVLLVGVFAGTLLCTVGALAVGTNRAAGRSLVMLGAWAVPLLLQDFWRFAAFAARRPAIAVLNDAVWFASLAILLPILVLTGRLSAETALMAWGAGAAIAAVVGASLFGQSRSSWRETSEWMRTHFSLAGWFGMAEVVYSAGSQTVMFILAATVGTTGVGGLRSVQNLLAPAMVISLGMQLFSLPTLARSVGTGDYRAERRLLILHMTLVGGFVALWVTLLVSTGSRVLVLVFGVEFGRFESLILPLGIVVFLSAGLSAAELGLRSRRLGRQLFSAQVLGSVSRVALVVLLAALAGLDGAAWGLVVAAAIHAGFAWALLKKHLPTHLD